MLLYSGELDGEFVEGKIVPAKKIIEELQLPLSLNEPSRFRLNKRQVAINRANGRERYAEVRRMKPIVQGTHQKLRKTFTLQYFTNRSPRVRGSGFNYYPSRIDFTGKEIKVSPTNIDQAIIFFLSGWCGDSPLKARPGGGMYKIYHAEEETRQELAKIHRDTKLQAELLNMNADSAMYLAKAINEVKGSIPNDDLDDPSSAKVALIKLYGSSPETVTSAMGSTRVEAASLMFQGLKEGIIEHGSDNRGSIVWKYTSEHGDGIIVKVDKKVGTRESFIRHLTAGLDTMQEFRKVLGKEVKQYKEPEAENIEIDSGLSADQVLVEKAIQRDVLGFHPGEEKVYLKNENGQFKGRALKVLEGTGDWKKDFIDSLTPQMAGRIEKAIEK